MNLYVVTSKPLKTLSSQSECLLATNRKVVVTDLALYGLKGELGYNAVNSLIALGFISVIETVQLSKITQYQELNLDIEQCSIRAVVDAYSDLDVLVTIIVDGSWAEMQLGNIQIISTAKYLKRKPSLKLIFLRQLKIIK